MSLPLVVAAMVAAAPAPDESAPSVIRMVPRAPLSLVLNTPSGRKGRLGVSEILDALAGPLEAQTDFTLRPMDESASASCRGAVACLARRTAKGSRHLLILSYFASPDDRPDRVSALLVDVPAAEACVADPFSGGNVDDCVRAKAIRARPRPKTLRTPEEARAALQKFVQEELRPIFEPEGHWQPYGAIEVKDVPLGTTVIMDETTVGAAPGGRLRVTAVGPGEHQLSVRKDGDVLAAGTVRVERGATAQLALNFRNPGFKQPLLWSGVSVAAVGLGFTTWSLAYATRQSGLMRSCPTEPCGSRFYTVEQMARGDLEIFEPDPNQGVVLGLPLGYSLMGMGGTWIAGSQLVEDDATMHWIVMGAGVVVGALAYGVSAAANGR